MKRLVLIIGIVIIAGLIIFTLFKNRAEMTQQARGNRKISFPVAVVKASKQKLDQSISQVASINAYNDVSIISEIQGKVTKVMVPEGSYVNAGAPILKIEDQVPEANFLAAQTNYQKAQKDWERSVSLHDQGLISDSQLEAARFTFKAAEASFISAQQQYHNSMITSPISGIITSLPVDIGTTVNSGTVVANVVDISRLKVKLNVDEQSAFKLKVGDQAVVETDVYPGVKFYGKVENISVKGDEAHTYPVKIVIPNDKQHPLKSGMFGRVTFHLGNQVALTIPRDALLGSIQNGQVFVVQNGKAKLRDIQVGSEAGTNISIIKGLKEGESVVVSGQINLKDNTEVTVADQNQPSSQGGKWPNQKGFRKQKPN